MGEYFLERLNEIRRKAPSKEVLIYNLVSELDGEIQMQVQSWLLALSRRIELQNWVAPVLVTSGFYRFASSKDFTELQCLGSLIEALMQVLPAFATLSVYLIYLWQKPTEMS
jgi:hypothetical protein